MRIAYFDCFAGVCGSMILGALVDAGLAPDDLRKGLAGLPLRDYELTFERATRNGIVGTLARVVTAEKHPQRTMADIEALVRASTLVPDVEARVLAVFARLATAEARVHGVSLPEVHFHEVGAVDAIIDIVGAVLGLHLLGVERMSASAIPTGAGFVRTLHGLLPVPAPAVAELLKRAPSYAGPERAELTTPTGAALLAELCSEFGPRPAMEIESIGYGAGEHRLDIPNFLRLFVGAPDFLSSAAQEGAPHGARPFAFPTETVWVIETLVDDATPEIVSESVRRLLEAGALDAYLLPAIGKKGRPSSLLCALAPTEEDTARLAGVIFEELPTLGVRFRQDRRFVLARSIESVALEDGSVRVKVGRDPSGQAITVAPEFEDCRGLAEARGTSVRSVYQEALRAYASLHSGE